MPLTPQGFPVTLTFDLDAETIWTGARPETADLLRRHVETLRQELRQEGLGSVGVSIGGGDAHQGGESAPRGGQVLAERPGPGFVAAVPAASPSLPALRERTPAGQLDLRF